jgi:hypothetical protein
MVCFSFLHYTSLCISCDKNLEEFLMLCFGLWGSCFSFLSIKFYVCTWIDLLFVNNYLLQIIKLEPSVHEDKMHILTIWTTKYVSNQTHIEKWERFGNMSRKELTQFLNRQINMIMWIKVRLDLKCSICLCNSWFILKLNHIVSNRFIHNWGTKKECLNFFKLQRTTLNFCLFYIIIVVMDCCMPIDKMASC